MLPRHDLDIRAEHILDVQAGKLIEVWTDQRLNVGLIRADLFDQTPVPNGTTLLPMSEDLIAELVEHGHTGFVPHSSPYIFSLRYIR